MRRLLLTLVAAATLTAVGCDSGGLTAEPTRPAPGLAPIEVVRSGGFAGVHQTLSVDGDGRWSADTGAGELSDAARTRLAAILADPALPTQIAAALPGECCDMFQYELRVGALTYDFGEPDLGPLLVELLELLREETGF